MSRLDRYLAVDSSAFLRNCQLQELAENIYTSPDIIGEIRDKVTLQRLQFLPYKLTVKSPDAQCLKEVTCFAKQTGDFRSLSKTDLSLIALTLQLTRDANPKFCLPDFPTKSTWSETNEIVREPCNLPGFYSGSKSSSKSSRSSRASSRHVSESESSATVSEHDDVENCDLPSCPVIEEDEDAEDLMDDDGWITPSNVAQLTSEAALEDAASDETLGDLPTPVACLTTDFAMQNTLIQMGLNVIGFNGLLIRQVRNYVQRCDACLKVTTKTDVRFCPNCGNDALRRLSAIVTSEGDRQFVLPRRKRVSAKGERHSLPFPKGGKHSTNPIVRPDQPLPQQRPSRKTLQANTDVLSADYVGTESPFAVRDVSSRAARLNIFSDRGCHDNINQWTRRSHQNSKTSHKSKRTSGRRR